MNYQQFFNDNSRLIKLEGESYITTKKLMLYSLLGNSLKFNHISLGLLEDDLRINAGIPIKSGMGKSIMKSFVNKTEKALERRCSIPTSLHPEQLIGKCCSGDTEVVLSNGSFKQIKNIRTGDEVLSAEDGKIIKSKVITKFENGKQSLYQLVTKDGRTIKATGNHLFLTRRLPKIKSCMRYVTPKVEEWKSLSKLKSGDEIAVPKKLTFGDKELPDNEVKLIAYLIGDGGIKYFVGFTNTDEKILSEVREIVKDYNCELVNTSRANPSINYRVKGNKLPINKVADLLKLYNLFGKGSSKKEMPEIYMQLNKRQSALFLSRLFACDGSLHIRNKNTFPHYGIEYDTTSKKLAYQVSCLLRRFEIKHCLFISSIKWKGEEYESYRINILERASVNRFLEEIGLYAKDETLDKSALENRNVTKRRRFSNELLIELLKKHNYCINAVANELGVDWVAIKWRAKKLQKLEKERQSEIKFVPIKEITHIGKEPTYDIQVDNNAHNFVANDMIVHNSIAIRDKEGNILETKINKGYLADDFVMYDEAVELLTDKAFQQARDYINIALDPIGDNEVLKRSVDTAYEDSVRYFPPCSMIFFWHPIPITESVVTRGLLRRLFITNIVIDAKEREEVLRKSVYTTSNNPKQFNEWIGTLNRLSKRTFDWQFSDKGKKELINLTKRLISTGVRYSEKISEFTDIMYFTLRNRLAKMACVLAALDGTPNISLRHLRFGYIDLREFWYNQMTYVEEKVLTGLSFGVPKAKIRKKMCLDVLKDHKAFSEETSPLSIADLLTEFGKRADISEGNARYYYLDLVKKGIVQSRKYAHSSRVWYAGAERELKKDVWGA